MTATWAKELVENVNCWKIVNIKQKNRGIVAAMNLKQGTIIAMYGGTIFD